VRRGTGSGDTGVKVKKEEIKRSAGMRDTRLRWRSEEMKGGVGVKVERKKKLNNVQECRQQSKSRKMKE
jgi:hypothetical protein